MGEMGYNAREREKPLVFRGAPRGETPWKERGQMMKRPLPIGIENFADMVKNEYYYVDKTKFIKELLDLKGKVNLFLRPRRFGKTLGLSMLQISIASVYGGQHASTHVISRVFSVIFNRRTSLYASFIFLENP